MHTDNGLGNGLEMTLTLSAVSSLVFRQLKLQRAGLVKN